MTRDPIGLNSGEIGDGDMLNHLIPEDHKKEIDKLWQAKRMRGREPRSYHQKLKRLEAKGVDISCVAPPYWGMPIPDWQKAIINGEGMEEAHRDWKNEQISNSLLKADMAAGAKGAKRAKLDKSRAIIEAYKSAQGWNPKAKKIPPAIVVAKWDGKRKGLSDKEVRNLARRLRRTQEAM